MHGEHRDRASAIDHRADRQAPSSRILAKLNGPNRTLAAVEAVWRSLVRPRTFPRLSGARVGGWNPWREPYRASGPAGGPSHSAASGGWQKGGSDECMSVRRALRAASRRA
jgi:hypothetical protein